MRIAHLILAHSDPGQLKRLIERLSHTDADFYIHIDLKAGIEQFLPLAEKGQVAFIKKREKVYWGAYSVVQATVNAFEEILHSGIEYDYINLLSGQDYPLLDINSIHRFFIDHRNKAFMRYLFVESQWHEAIPRIEKYHLANYQIVGKHRIEQLMNTILPKREVPNGLIPVGRSQWFTITPEHVKYIVNYLQQNKNVRSFFQLTWGCDEIIFQTILFNSPFKDDMINDNLRYVDWSEGKASPKTFTLEDADTLMHCGKLFARKFDAKVDSAILDYIDESIS